MRTPTASSLRPLSFSLARLSSSLAIAAAISLAGSSARALTLQWDPNGSLTNPPTNGNGSWSTGTASWFNGSADVVWNNGGNNIAQFNGTGGGAPFTVSLDTDITANSILFNTDGYSISGVGTTLSITSGNVTVGPGVTAILAATVGGAGMTNGLTLSGGGTLELTQANTYTGITTVNAGSVLRADTATSTGAVVLNAGTLEIGNGTGITYNRSIALNDGATLLAGVGAPMRSNGVLTIADSAVVNINTAAGQTFTLGDAANDLTGGSGSLIQVGGAADGTVVLTNSNNLTANWNINAGTVTANSLTSLGTGGATVNTGATLAYTLGGDLNTPVTLNGGTLMQSAAAQLTLQRQLVVNAPSTISIPLVNPGKIFVNAGISGTGDLTKTGNGILQIVQANPNFSGNWTINGGFVEVQNNDALGTGSVTVNTGGELVSSPTQVPNRITIGSPGAVLSYDNGNTGNFLGAITAANDFSVGLRYFYNLGAAANGAIGGSISGPGVMTVLTPPTPAQITLGGNNSAWTGGIVAPNNVQVRVTEGSLHGLGTGAVVAPGGLFLTVTPDLVVGANPGFSARYYSSVPLLGTGVIGGFDFGVQTPAATRNEDVVDLIDTGNGTQPNPPIPGFSQDHNGELWTSILNITNEGTYTFQTASDDGSLLYVDGQQVVQNDFAQGLFARTGNINLTPGFHSLIVKYGQGTGGGGMHANYTGPDTGGVQILIGSLPGTVTNTGSQILGTTTVTRDIPLGTTGQNGFDLAAVNATFSGALTFQPGITLTVTGVTGSETLTQSGPVTLNGVNPFVIGIHQVPNGASGASAGADMIISGSIGEAVAGSGITKSGPRTLTLSGTNTYTGVTTVNEGALQLASPVPNSGVSAAGLVINATLGDAVVRLLANEQLPDALTLTISSAGTNGALFDLNDFTETVNGLNITGTGVSSTGVLTGGGGTLKVLGNVVLNNNRAAINNTGREVLISSTGTYGFPSVGFGTLDLGGAIRNFTVETTNTGINLPNSDATIETNIINGGINKLGSRTLILAGVNSYAGGTVITAGTVRATGPAGATSTSLGTGLVTLNGGSLELRNNGTGNNGEIAYPNDLTIDPSQAVAGFDINNNGANTGNTISLNSLLVGSQTLNITGGNGYKLRFNSVNLTGNPTLNPTSGTLTLSNISETGGAHTLTKSGVGTLILTGNSTFTGGVNVLAGSGPVRVVPSVGSTNKPAGTGTISLANGTLMQIAPSVTSISGAGAVAGSLTAKFYNGGQTINGSEIFELPTAVTSVPILADGTFFNRPSVVTPANATNMLAVYSGLLNITTAGTYNFQTAGGDESQLLIDGVPVVSVNTGGGGQVFTDSASAPVTLSAGFHTFTMKAFNAGSGGGVRVRYQGADTNDNLQVIPASRLYSAPSQLNAGNVGAAVSIAAGAATIDSLGSDFDTSVSGLTLGAGVVANIANAGGGGALNINGNITLQGAAAVNLATSALNLMGDIADGGNNFTLTKNGAGALILTGAKTFGGGLTINQGGVQITNAASLGGTANGTVIANTVTPLSSSTSIGSTTVTVGSTAGLVVGAFVSGTGIPAGATIASISANGTTLTLSANATVTGTNNLNYTIGGTLDLNGVALNAEPLTISGGGSASSPAALYNSSSLAASAAGPITIGSTGTKIGGYGDITLTGTLSGIAANDLTKVGVDTLTINGSNLATFLGTMTVSQGLLKLGNDGALGATGAAANTIVSSGAALDLNGRTIGESLTISGVGLVNLFGTNTLGSLINTNASLATITGPITLAAASSVGSPLAGGGNITLNGAVGGNFALTKVGTNTLTLGAVNGYTGAGTVQLGTLVLSGLGTVATEASMTVDPKATLTLDDSGTNNTTGSRLGSKRLTLIGGSLNILGNSGANTVEDLGAGQLFIDSQNAVVTLTPGAGRNVKFNATGTGVLVNTSGLLRNGSSTKGTALFRGTNLGVNAIGTAGDASITFGGLIPTVGQSANTAAGNTDRAIIPWALVDTTTGGSGSSFAAYSATNGLQAMQAGDFVTTIAANPPKINNVVASSGISAPAGAATSINSLTLKTGGSLNIDAGSIILLDSGGVLATANSSITGAGTLTSTVVASANREVIVQTAGTGTKLTVSAPISVNGGLTKSGDGTLTFNTQQPITGQIRLNAGKTELAGGANTIAYAVTAPPAVGSTASVPSNNTILIDNGATLDLLGNDQRFGGFASNAVAGTNLPGTSGTITNSSGTTANLRIGMKNTVATLPTEITGKINLQRDGGTTLPVTSAWTYDGSTTLNGGVLTLVDAGALPNTSSLAIHRASLRLDNSGLQAATRLNASAPVTLDGGAISFVSRSNTADVLNLGATSLNSGASLISQTLGGTATPTTNTGISIVSIASLARSQGATINFAVTTNNNVALGDNPRVLLGTGTPTLVGGLVGGWATTTGYNSSNPISGNSSLDFAAYDPVAGFHPTNYTSVFAPGNNVNLEPNNAAGPASTTLPGGDTSINSLRIGGLGSTTTNTLNFVSPTDTLNLESGGLLSTSSPNARAIGGSPNGGLLTAGGLANSGTSELFIHNGNNTLTINAQIVNNPNGAQVALVLDAVSLNSTIQLAGSNTYTGTTYVNGVIATLNSPGLAIPGNLIISGGTINGGDSQTTANQTVRLLAANQIAPTANVTVNGGSQLDLNGFANTLNNLTLAADGGSSLNIGPSVQTGAGTLTLNGSITATNLQATTIPVIGGNLALSAGAHNVGIGTAPGAPGQVGLQINSQLSGSGSLNVTSGVLGLGTNASTTPINLAAAATLNISTFSPTIGTLTGAGTVTGTSGAATLTVGNDGGSGTFTGLIAGPVTFAKTGGGTQTIATTSGRPTLTNTGGTLQLSTGVELAALNAGAGTLTKLTAHSGGPGNVKALDTQALTFTGNGTLDLTNNAMVVRGGSVSDITAKLTSGFNGFLWNGPGINSSTAAADASVTGLTAVGVINNVDFGLPSFAGVNGLTGNEILVKYTYLGDADLNGVVNVDDFNNFAAGFNHEAGTSPYWFFGDFDYNGVVNVDDFGLFASAFTDQGGQLRGAESAILSQELGQLVDQIGLGTGSSGGSSAGSGDGSSAASQAVVPEPGSIGLLAVGAFGLISRRRRKA